MIVLCPCVLTQGFSFERVIIRVEVKHNMPNAKVLSEKQAIVEALAERIKGASAGILVDYKGNHRF